MESSDVSWKLPGGGYLSTLEDLARFADGVARKALLKEATWELMWTPQRAPETDEGAIGYGLGFGLRRVADGHLRVSHSGAQNKTRTLMRVFPANRTAVVLMTNSEWAQLAPIADALEETLEATLARRPNGGSPR